MTDPTARDCLYPESHNRGCGCPSDQPALHADTVHRDLRTMGFTPARQDDHGWTSGYQAIQADHDRVYVHHHGDDPDRAALADYAAHLRMAGYTVTPQPHAGQWRLEITR